MVQLCDFVLVQACVFVLSRSLSQVVLQATRLSRSLSQVVLHTTRLSQSLSWVQKWSLLVSESATSAQESFVADPSEETVVGKPSEKILVAELVVVSQKSVVVCKWLLLLLSDPKWLLLLLPEDLFALVAEGSQVLVGFADKRLLAENDWVVWSPLVMIAAMAALGSS